MKSGIRIMNNLGRIQEAEMIRIQTDPDPKHCLNFLLTPFFFSNVADPDPFQMKRIRIRVAKNQAKSWKINENHKNIIHFFLKTFELIFTDINIYPINNKTDQISEKYIFYRKKN